MKTYFIHKTECRSGKRLRVSFSGGETSARMAYWLLVEGGAEKMGYSEFFFSFSNTGEEDEKTLEFIKMCDEQFGLNTVWLEAVFHMNQRKGPTSKVVDFETASRNGEPFEAAIRKHGIPNQTFKYCTSKLKENPMTHFTEKVLGWKKGTYDTAIGIRIDEVDRINPDNAKKNKLVYPLAKEFPLTKPQINSWWASRNFRLNLKSWQGNCKLCLTKTKRKHFTLLHETPEAFDFPIRMEEKYAHTGPEFKKGFLGGEPLPENYKRTFFRGNQTVGDMRKEYEEAVSSGNFVSYHDESMVFEPELDTGGGCGDSCEVWADE